MPRKTIHTQFSTVLFQIDDVAEAKRRQQGFRRRGSVLDLIDDQAKQLSRNVGKRDRVKLVEYFSAVREVESQLQRDIDWSTKPKPTPEMERIGDYSRSLTPKTPEFDYVEYQQLMYDLIALAFKTDSTRVNHLQHSTGVIREARLPAMMFPKGSMR